MRWRREIAGVSGLNSSQYLNSHCSLEHEPLNALDSATKALGYVDASMSCRFPMQLDDVLVWVDSGLLGLSD